MEFPKGLKYTKEHEWANIKANESAIGITDYAQEELGDIVFVELPQIGRDLKKGESFGVIESVKAVSDIYSPLSGKVKEINSKLTEEPEILNKDPYGNGWMIKLEISNQEEFDDLMNSDEYEKYVAEEKKL